MATLTYAVFQEGLGWTPEVANTEVAGSGVFNNPRPISAIRVTLSGNTSGIGLQYLVHIPRLGWEPAVSSGVVSGREPDIQDVNSQRRFRMDKLSMNLINAAHRAQLTCDVFPVGIGWLGGVVTKSNIEIGIANIPIQAIRLVYTEFL
ncbi:MAG: hypothetical protein Fur0022_08850 [Anaerolineales bacterium]